MNKNSTGATIFLTFLVLLILLNPILIVNFYQRSNEDLDSQKDEPKNVISNGQQKVYEDTKGDIDTKDISGTRGDYSETESNDGYSSANDISSIIKPINVNGQLFNRGDFDTFKISLDGEANPVDNLTVTLTYLNCEDWSTEYYSTFYMSIYGKFEKKYLLMKVVSIRVNMWDNVEDLSPATIHAFNSDDYYIRLSSSAQYSWADQPILYTLRVNTKQVNVEDENQVIDDADELIGPISTKKVTMATDIFDWYYINAPNPDDYAGEFNQYNFSISIDITNCLPMQTEYINGISIYFVTELHVLIYHKSKSVYKGLEIIGNKFSKYDHDNPIIHYEWTSEESTYIGIFVQTIGKTINGDGEYVLGDGYCDGWADYKITKLRPKPMIKPVLSDAIVQSPLGKVYDTFQYLVTYTDENNDPPKRITITIDNGDIGPEKMVKLDESDKDYTDGCVYKYFVDGSDYDAEFEVHEFRIFAEDIEVKAQNLDGYGPIITDNILPIVRPSGQNQYIIYEDDPVSYLDLNTTFEDPDNDTLFYRLSDGEKQYSKVYHSENISIRVKTIEDEEGNPNKYLEFSPKKNMFNRQPDQHYGSEVVFINVSDDNPNAPKYPDQNGNLTPAHYIWNPFELNVIIIGINDPPKIKNSFSWLFPYGLNIEEDIEYRMLDLNEIFWDPIENDQLTFSVRNNKNIDVRFYLNGTVDLIPKENWTGTESLEFIADDGFSTVEDTLKITIVETNDDPFLEYISKQIIYEGAWYNFTFSGYDYADNEPVFYETNFFELFESSEAEYSLNSETGEFSFKPNNNHVGTYKDFKVTVKDYNGGETSQLVVLEIRNSPDPPEPKILAPTQNNRFLNTDIIDFNSEFYDPDDEILIEKHTYLWSSSIDGYLNTSMNFRTSLSTGDHVITLMVSDPILNGTQSIIIRVVKEDDKDADKDKIPDYWEILYSLNENNPNDAGEDPDRDLFTNLEEYLGMDGKEGGDDDTDPTDPESHPDIHYSKSTKSDETVPFIWLIFSIIIIIIIISILYGIIQNSRRRKRESEFDQEKSKERVIYKDMFGRKYQVHKYEPINIICYNCLEKMEVTLPIRPLVVTCPKCNERGVLYK